MDKVNGCVVDNAKIIAHSSLDGADHDTGLTITVTGTQPYNDGYNNGRSQGRADVKFSDIRWDKTNQVGTVTLLNSTETKTLIPGHSAASRSGNIVSWKTTINGAETGDVVQFDAGSEYQSGANSVTLSKAWSVNPGGSQTVTVSASNGKSLSATITDVEATWNTSGTTGIVRVIADGTSHFSKSIDATQIFNNGLASATCSIGVPTGSQTDAYRIMKATIPGSDNYGEMKVGWGTENDWKDGKKLSR